MGWRQSPKMRKRFAFRSPSRSYSLARHLSVAYQNTRPLPIGSMPKRRPRPHVSLEMPRETCCSSKRATPRKPGVAARARVRLAQQLLADHGIQSICADQQVRLQPLPIGEVTNDMPLL
jgi:hypothetical protein